MAEGRTVHNEADVPGQPAATLGKPQVQPLTLHEDSEHQIPDGGYGWIIVACASTVNAFTWGVLSSYGVYLAYYLANDIFPEASHLDYAYIGGLGFGVAVLVASPVTYLTRVFGTHIPMVFGALMQTGGFVAASYAKKIWQLYLTQGIMVGIGVGFLFIPSVAITSQWFDKKRSLAVSINSAGVGIGGFIISFATQPMIDNISLAWSLRIIGIVSGVMNITATIFIRNRNKVVRPLMRKFNGPNCETLCADGAFSLGRSVRSETLSPPTCLPPVVLGLLLGLGIYCAIVLFV
jgi:hypothetical protein